MKNVYAAALAVFLFTGCGGDSTSDPASTGVHFQGRDCLSCHNKDLAPSSHLTIGGTVYRSPTSNKNNLNEACSERLHIAFGSAVNTTEYANAADAAGFNGRGNVFAFIKDMPITGTYRIDITRDGGVVLESSLIDHPFMGGFDENNPSDDNNRYSCNTCHQAPPNNLNGAPGLLYATGCL